VRLGVRGGRRLDWFRTQALVVSNSLLFCSLVSWVVSVVAVCFEVGSSIFSVIFSPLYGFFGFAISVIPFLVAVKFSHLYVGSSFGFVEPFFGGVSLEIRLVFCVFRRRFCVDYVALRRAQGRTVLPSCLFCVVRVDLKLGSACWFGL